MTVESLDTPLSLACAPSTHLPRVPSDKLTQENVKAYFEENVDSDLVTGVAIDELAESIIEFFPKRNMILGKMTVLLNGSTSGGTYLTDLLEDLEGQSPAPSCS